jgi:hypothetical protein
MHEIRRVSPRIEMEALCWEIIDERETSALVVEVMWARADVVFDQLVASQSPQAGPFGLLRRTGYRIAIAAARDLRLLRDYVFEVYRSQIDVYNARYASTMRSAL